MPWTGAPGSQVFARGNGVYSGATTWVNTSAVFGVEAGHHDVHDEDIADAIDACLKKDGGNSPTANIPMGGFKLTGLAAGAASGESVRYEQLDSAVLTTQGDLLVRGASANERLAKGTAGHVLRMGASQPAWAANGAADLSAFRAHKGTSNQVLSTASALTTITFGSAALNQGSNYNTGASAWTPPAGLVRLDVLLTYSSSGPFNYHFGIFKNGTTSVGGVDVSGDAATDLQTIELHAVDLAGGSDAYTVRYYSGDVGITLWAQRTSPGPYQVCNFMGHRI